MSAKAIAEWKQVVRLDPRNAEAWALLGELYDRTGASRFRTFTTVIPINPSLYGPTTPGEARTHSFNVAVLSDVTWEDAESS